MKTFSLNKTIQVLFFFFLVFAGLYFSKPFLAPFIIAVLAIPTLGIVKIICDHVEPLKPYGFLIGEEKKKDDKNLVDKIKGWFSRR